MPDIFPSLRDLPVFEPDATHAMSVAFEEVCRALKPIFYSWSGRTWRKPLILLERRGRFCENVVPRF